ncbi:unnamed protein product [Meloidogyne enterolobii]|uniref:Uncharacterized protein n=1 Tax=Meloidogyne enterolobii TaxID=390850 RepID=A0ACB1A1P1_MELEN
MPEGMHGDGDRMGSLNGMRWRGLRTGIAMLAYGMLEKAEPWIEILESFHSESIMRQTAVCMGWAVLVGDMSRDELGHGLISRIRSDIRV